MHDEAREQDPALGGKGTPTENKVAVEPNVSSSDLGFPAMVTRGGKREIGSTFFVRKNDGITALLHSQGLSSSAGIPVLVEASYDHGMAFLQGHEIIPTCEFPNILCIAGGVGITAMLPILDRANNLSRPIGTTKLYWGVRTRPLMGAVEEMLHVRKEKTSEMKDIEEKRWGSVEVIVSIGHRLDLQTLTQTELKSQIGGTTMVVCGPPEMADEVRCIVLGISRHATKGGPVARLVVECFSW